jgi:hypothetical protein
MKFVTERPFADPDPPTNWWRSPTGSSGSGRPHLYRAGQQRLPRRWLHAGPVPRRSRARDLQRLAVAARERDLREVHPRRCRAVRLMAASIWSRKFDEPIPLPRGRRLVTLRRRRQLHSQTAGVRAHGPRMAGGHGSAGPGRDAGWADNVCAHRHHAVTSSGCLIQIGKTVIGDAASWRGTDDATQSVSIGNLQRWRE